MKLSGPHQGFKDHVERYRYLSVMFGLFPGKCRGSKKDMFFTKRGIFLLVVCLVVGDWISRFEKGILTWM